MKRAISAAISIGMFSAFLLVGTAQAHVFKDSPEVTIHKMPTGTVSAGDRVVIFGRVKAPHNFCKVNRVLRLTLSRTGPDRVLDTDRTDGEGEYRFVRHPGRDQTFYVVLRSRLKTSYGHSHECEHAESGKVSVNVA